MLFWAFYKKAKNPQNLKYTFNLWIATQGVSLARSQWRRTLSFWAECVSTKRKIHALNIQTRALILWILRFLTKAQYDNVIVFWILSTHSVWQKIAKYDEIYQYDKDNKIRQNKSVWQNLGFCLNFCKLLCKSALILRTMTKNLQKFTKISSHFVAQIQASFPTFRK